MTVVFRPGERGEVSAVVALLQDDGLGSRREGSVMAPYVAAYDAMARENNNLLIVGMLDDRVVATYQLTFIWGLSLRASRRAQIESVRVAKDLRGQGIGHLMIEDAVRRARSMGCGLIQLTMHKRRTDTARFYEDLGFTASHFGFKRSLV